MFKTAIFIVRNLVIFTALTSKLFAGLSSEQKLFLKEYSSRTSFNLRYSFVQSISKENYGEFLRDPLMRKFIARELRLCRLNYLQIAKNHDAAAPDPLNFSTLKHVELYTTKLISIATPHLLDQKEALLVLGVLYFFSLENKMELKGINPSAIQKQIRANISNDPSLLFSMLEYNYELLHKTQGDSFFPYLMFSFLSEVRDISSEEIQGELISSYSIDLIAKSFKHWFKSRNIHYENQPQYQPEDNEVLTWTSLAEELTYYLRSLRNNQTSELKILKLEYAVYKSFERNLQHIAKHPRLISQLFNFYLFTSNKSHELGYEMTSIHLFEILFRTDKEKTQKIIKSISSQYFQGIRNADRKSLDIEDQDFELALTKIDVLYLMKTFGIKASPLTIEEFDSLFIRKALEFKENSQTHLQPFRSGNLLLNELTFINAKLLLALELLPNEERTHALKLMVDFFRSNGVSTFQPMWETVFSTLLQRKLISTFEYQLSAGKLACEGEF